MVKITRHTSSGTFKDSTYFMNMLDNFTKHMEKLPIGATTFTSGIFNGNLILQKKYSMLSIQHGY